MIGWQLTRKLEKGMKKIVQSAYINVFLEEVDRADCISINIPMKAGAKTDMGEPEVDEKADLRLYQRLSGEPMYLLELQTNHSILLRYQALIMSHFYFIPAIKRLITNIHLPRPLYSEYRPLLLRASNATTIHSCT